MNTPAILARSELGRLIWTFRKELGWAAVFSFFCNLLMLTPTVYMLQMFDRVMLSGNETTLVALTLITLAFFALLGFSEWIRSRLMVRTSARLDEAISRRVFEATFKRSLTQGATRASQSFNDMTHVRQYLTGAGVMAIFDTPWAVIYIAVSFLLHPLLGWATVFFAVLTLITAILGNKAGTRQIEASNEAAVEAAGYLTNKIRNAETVEALGMLPALRRQWLHLHDAQRSKQGIAFDLNLRVQSATKYLQYLQSSLMLALAALLALDGQIGMGALIASNSLTTLALRPISSLVATWRQFVDARQGYRRLDALLAEAPAQAHNDGPQPLRGAIQLEHLTASAPGRAEPILSDLNATFSAGEVVGIVGPSGAGKSTLARCLLGVWPDTTGSVRIDGRLIEEWPRDQLGAQVGFLPQDIELFDGTIAENIARFGKPDPELVIAAAKRTGIHDMVLRMPLGYDTPMGDSGQFLSGGQRQRVGLARALYGEPSLVVLDEPNANLDDAGEAALMQAVVDLKAKGKTVFLIVHQPQLLSLTDKVILLEAGRITRIGAVAKTGASNRLETQP